MQVTHVSGGTGGPISRDTRGQPGSVRTAIVMDITTMIPEPEFLHAPERQLVALSRDFTVETRNEIPELWNDFWTRGWEFVGDEQQAAYGVSYSVRSDGRFSYAAGRSIDPIPKQLPEGACIVTISGGRYAAFRQRGPIAEIPALFEAILTQWLQTSGEMQREGAVFERYPCDDGAPPESITYEIWVPVAG